MGIHGSKSSNHSNVAPVKSKVLITSSDRAQLELKLQRDRLAAAIRKYETTAEEERARAADFLRSGNRRKALYCIKREQLQRSQVTSVTDMLDNVQKLIDTVEFSQIEMEVFDALKNGKDELSKLNSMLNIDDITELMNETSETIEEARRINDVLGQPLEEYDEETLLKELIPQVTKEDISTKNVLEEAVVPTHNIPNKKESNNSISENKIKEEMLPA